MNFVKKQVATYAQEKISKEILLFQTQLKKVEEAKKQLEIIEETINWVKVITIGANNKAFILEMLNNDLLKVKKLINKENDLKKQLKELEDILSTIPKSK